MDALRLNEQVKVKKEATKLNDIEYLIKHKNELLDPIEK